MNKKDLTISFVLNIIIFILVTLGTIFMVTGFKFMGNTQVLASTGFSPLKYYTVDSNIFVGFASLMLIICECYILNKKMGICKNTLNWGVNYVNICLFTLTC